MATYTFIARNSANGTSGSTIAATVPAAMTIPIGALVVVRAAYFGTIASMASSPANTWTRDVNNVDATNSAQVVVYHSILTSALTTGNTITATGSSFAVRAIDAIWCSTPNGTQATVFDKSGTGQETTGSTTATCSSTGTLSTVNSLAVYVEVDSAAASATPAGSWTEDSDVVIGGPQHFETQTRIVTATTALVGTATLSTSTTWDAAVATYNVDPPAAAGARNLMMLGVGT